MEYVEGVNGHEFNIEQSDDRRKYWGIVRVFFAFRNQIVQCKPQFDSCFAFGREALRCGLIHGDISDRNMVIRKDNDRYSSVLLDFSFAKEMKYGNTGNVERPTTVLQ